MIKNNNKLRGKIIEHYGSQREFAKALDVSEQTVVAKLNGHTSFSQKDIVKWCELLHINSNDIVAYFFG